MEGFGDEKNLLARAGITGRILKLIVYILYISFARDAYRYTQ